MKEKQEEAILHFISGQDIFVLLSTGYGKSLLFGIWGQAWAWMKVTVLHVQKLLDMDT